MQLELLPSAVFLRRAVFGEEYQADGCLGGELLSFCEPTSFKYKGWIAAWFCASGKTTVGGVGATAFLTSQTAAETALAFCGDSGVCETFDLWGERLCDGCETRLPRGEAESCGR